MGRRLATISTLLAAALALAACGPVGMVTTGATVVSVIQSEETLTDKALSWALNKDCSIFHAARGEEYCKPIAPELPAQYCYRNLGGITCYSQPDPNASPEIAVFATPPDPESPEAAGGSAPRPPQSTPARRNPAH